MKKADRAEIIAKIDEKERKLGLRRTDTKKRIALRKQESASASRSDLLVEAFLDKGMDERYIADKVQLLLNTTKKGERKVFDPDVGGYVMKAVQVPDTNALLQGLKIMIDAFGARFEPSKSLAGSIPVQFVTVFNDFRRETQQKDPYTLAAEAGLEIDAQGNVVDDRQP